MYNFRQFFYKNNNASKTLNKVLFLVFFFCICFSPLPLLPCPEFYFELFPPVLTGADLGFCERDFKRAANARDSI